MFDAHIGEVNLTLLVIVLSVVLVLPVQYWLCRRERALFVRLGDRLCARRCGVRLSRLQHKGLGRAVLHSLRDLLRLSARGERAWLGGLGSRCMAEAAREISRVSHPRGSAAEFGTA